METASTPPNVQELKVTTVRHEQALSVTLEGDLVHSSLGRLKDELDVENDLQGCKYLILNLHTVNYLDSAGMAVLIRIARQGRKNGYRMFVCGVSIHYQKLFRLVGLTEHVMIYPDEYAVMQRLAVLEGEQ
ncbi:anti-sigma factor antagonist [Paenibacillus sambharensis]|uniref:Anti-sigma factor antagonist n=2 Tax=Paenibacillus sambharensis TaxID=1803190 RepID=A0A2W1LFS6_9BACL|nr:anti-sigma factor antagonist [Paenibacillus sambharensis]